MLEEVKTNTFELFISNSKQVGSYQIKQEANIKANDPSLTRSGNLRSDENSFSGVMNNLHSRPKQETSTVSESEKPKEITPREIIQASNKITQELKNEIQSTETSTEAKELNNQDLSSLEKHKKSEDQEINYLVLSEMKQHVDYEIEKISKSIAELDLESPEGINQIIELSDQLEALRSLDSLIDTKLQAIDLPIEKQITLDEVELDLIEPNTPFLQIDLVTKNNVNKTTIRADIATKTDSLKELKLDILKTNSLSETLTVSDSEEIKNLETNLKSIKNLSNSLILESTQEAQVKEIKIQPELSSNTLTKNLVDQERFITLAVKPNETISETEEPSNTSVKPINNTTQEPEISTQDPEISTQEPKISTQEPKISTQEPKISTKEPTVKPLPEPVLKPITETPADPKAVTDTNIVRTNESKLDKKTNLETSLQAEAKLTLKERPEEKIASSLELTNKGPAIKTESKSRAEVAFQSVNNLEPSLNVLPPQSGTEISSEPETIPTPIALLKSEAQKLNASEPSSITKTPISSLESQKTINSNPIKNQSQASSPDADYPEISFETSESKISISTKNEITNNLKVIQNLNSSTEKTSTASTTQASPEAKNITAEKIAIVNSNVITNTKEATKTNPVTLEASLEEGLTELEDTNMVINTEDGASSEMSDMESESFNQQSQPETQEFVPTNNEIKNTDSFKVNNKIQAHRTPISLNELSNVLAREVVKVSPGETQELTMSLTPGDMGQIELTISKSAGNKLEIKMVFSQENAFNTVEHKLTELRSILKSRGFEAQIELSRSESTSTENFNRPGQDSFNEAKEEQKERILNTMPEWLRPQEEDSFKSTLQQMI